MEKAKKIDKTLFLLLKILTMLTILLIAVFLLCIFFKKPVSKKSVLLDKQLLVDDFIMKAETYEHSSGSIYSNGIKYQLGLTVDNYQMDPPDLNENIPCVLPGQIKTGISGDFYLTLQREVGEEIIDRFPLGKMYFSWETEENGRFTTQVISQEPKYTVATLAMRIDCNKNITRLFGFDPDSEKIVEYKFYKNSGEQVDLTIPSGHKIPQQDNDLNMIYDVPGENENTREKIRFAFDSSKLPPYTFFELETWSQLQP